MPILEAPAPPRPGSQSQSQPQSLYTGFSTSHSMQSMASSSSYGYTNGHVNGVEASYMHADNEQEMTEDSEAETEISEDEETLYDVHIEVRLSPNSAMPPHHIPYMVKNYITDGIERLELGQYLAGWRSDSELCDHVASIWVEEGDRPTIDVKDANLQIHVYRLRRTEQIADFDNDLEDTDESESVSAGSMRILPSAELDGLWQTLVYSNNLKTRLLNYCYSTTYFSENEIDSNVIAWNRVMLLHGPPGTGKTSLCRALAQKISIRMSDSYPRSKLIEINSHSLFSKWFSESGKLVQKLFDTITLEVDDEQQFVVLMIDEVESLTAARSAAMTGNEPSDSLRVVNALLTQLDRLKTRKNVLVMTTSNLVDAIDEAFMSRVDMLELVPLPPPEAVYSILKGCVEEMMSKQMIKSRSMLNWARANDYSFTWEGQDDKSRRYSGALAQLAIRCHELEVSGRTLRKLPVLAHTRKLSQYSGGQNRRRPLGEWISAMMEIVESFAPLKSRNSNPRSRLSINDDDQRGNEMQVQSTKVNGHHQKSSSVVSIDRGHIGQLIASKGGKDISGGE
ncbi:uncharacterized protein I303_100680 [Kwoniella dejecticola CBS 10117]|uniref:AAA+ ATPase domain-containing protein n=1 Tax=Kwoniella dejecticola CBS 10117 TaxID=1296121 RepID=A0A1A6AFL4_9TREE|nr:uncharacterized protein I303_00684 [Kwoniella dejecticola CBS 10117]OBR88867.1 hypothetical protein I303_00684 [Kwoniella dejecticola CBS 10117]